MNDLGFDIDDILSSSGTGLLTYQDEVRDELAEFDNIIRDYDLSAMQMKLATYVEERFFEARNARRAEGVDEEMDKSARAYNDTYNPEDAAMVAATSDIYAPMTKTKCRGLQNWIMDILANAEDKPWTMTASPEPDVPGWMQEEIVQRLEAEVLANGVTGDLAHMAKQMKELAKKHSAELANEATERMEQRVYDQLLQSGWRDQFRQFIDDLSYMPSAVMFGPSVEMRRKLRYNGDKAEEIYVPVHVLRRVNPPDFYPAPGSSDTQTAPYLCEVRVMTSSQLMDATNLFGVDQSAVRKLLQKNPNGHTIADRQSADRPAGVTNTSGPARVYETIVYYGAVDGRVLMEHGILDVDPQGHEEMEVWVCDGLVLRALRNPYPLQRRPYHSSSFLKRSGKFWGTSLPSVLGNLQRIVNGAVRNLVRDMSFSSGPIGEYDIERMVSEDRVDEFSPYRLFAVKPDYTQGGASAIRFQRLPSNAQQFVYVYDRYMKEADDVSGIPAYVIGNPNVAGAGRTLGGLSLLMGNAAKGVKRVIADLDKDMIEPIVTMFYELNLIYSPDDSIKADAVVVARGASGLLQRELSQSRAAEVLPMLTQGAQMGLVEPAAISTVMRDILKSLGYPEDLVIDPDRERLLEMLGQMAGSGGGSGPLTDGRASSSPGMSQPMLPPPSPGVALDGRSMPPPDPSAAERI